MQTVGIFVIGVAIWVIYCGLYGIPPIATALTVIQKPGDARETIDQARKLANEKYASLFTAAKTAGISGANVLGFTGINPYALFIVSQSWAEHVANTGRGAVDYVMPVGTPLIAVRAGTVNYIPNNGDAGNEARITFADGYTQVLDHLSSFSRVNGDKVNTGALIGLSGGAKGAPGAGNSTGAHLHTYVLDPTGKRIEFSKYMIGVLT